MFSIGMFVSRLHMRGIVFSLPFLVSEKIAKNCPINVRKVFIKSKLFGFDNTFKEVFFTRIYSHCMYEKQLVRFTEMVSCDTL